MTTSTQDHRGRMPTSTRRGAQFVACLLLVAQYLLGMVVNLFVTIPAHRPGNYFAGAVSGIALAMRNGPAWLAVHVAFGLALVVASLIIAATSSGNGRGVAVTSGLGSLAIIGAAFNGASFLAYAQNFSSMIMAGLWAVALGCYATGLFFASTRTVRHDRS